MREFTLEQKNEPVGNNRVVVGKWFTHQAEYEVVHLESLARVLA
jgi:hypothetical protein